MPLRRSSGSRAAATTAAKAVMTATAEAAAVTRAGAVVGVRSWLRHAPRLRVQPRRLARRRYRCRRMPPADRTGGQLDQRLRATPQAEPQRRRAPCQTQPRLQRPRALVARPARPACCRVRRRSCARCNSDCRSNGGGRPSYASDCGRRALTAASGQVQEWGARFACRRCHGRHRRYLRRRQRLLLLPPAPSPSPPPPPPVAPVNLVARARNHVATAPSLPLSLPHARCDCCWPWLGRRTLPARRRRHVAPQSARASNASRASDAWWRCKCAPPPLPPSPPPMRGVVGIWLLPHRPW